MAVENILFSRDEYGGLSGNEDAGRVFLEFGNKKKIEGREKRTMKCILLILKLFISSVSYSDLLLYLPF